MLHFLFSFRGRVNRAKFWTFYLCGSLVVSGGLMALTELDRVATNRSWVFDGTWPHSPLGWVIELPMDALYLLFFFSLVAMIVKRLHDRGKNAWWLAIYYSPIIAFALIDWFDLELRVRYPLSLVVPMVLFAIAAVIGVWYLVELLFLPGTRGDNRFGPDLRAKKTPN